MRRLIRLVVTTGLAGFVALLPSVAQASSEDVTVNLFGVEYAATSTQGSFAGLGTTTTGQPVAFNTTIIHDPLTSLGSAEITGGTFTVRIGPSTLAGTYVDGGMVGPGHVSPLYPGSVVFCKETFPVNVQLAPARVLGATSINDGTAIATLTHVGVFEGLSCNAFAASIKGQAMLS